MYSPKLSSCLESLSRAEKTRFRDFVGLSFFNKNQDVCRFLDILYRDTDKKLSKEQVFEALYPGRRYEARKITDQVYYLTRLAEQFLEYLKTSSDPVLQNISLLGECLDRSIEKTAIGISSDIQDQLDATRYRDQAHYYREYLYHTEMDRFFVGKEEVKRDESLQKKTDSLDLFYIATKLRDCCEMLNRSQIMQSSYHIPMLGFINSYVASNLSDFGQYPAISVYHHILLMLQNPDEAGHFSRLAALLDTSHGLFPDDELRDIYNYARNYCIRKINAGDNGFYGPLFAISKRLVETGLVLSGKYITQRDYKNIVSMALRLGETDWALSFLNGFKNSLAPEHRQNAWSYNLANYYYETQQYAKAVKLLRDVEFTDLYYNLDAKTMLLKMYYEQDEDESFMALAAAFRNYLTRNRIINKQTYTIYNNLLIYTRKAFALKNLLPYQRKKDFAKKVKELGNKVEGSRNIVNSKWLLEEIGRL